jgi:hypothetical protein
MESFDEGAQLASANIFRVAGGLESGKYVSRISLFTRGLILTVGLAYCRLAVVLLNAGTLDLWDVDRMLRPIVIHATSAAWIPPKHRGLYLFHLLYLAIISASVSGNACCFAAHRKFLLQKATSLYARTLSPILCLKHQCTPNAPGPSAAI